VTRVEFAFHVFSFTKTFARHSIAGLPLVRGMGILPMLRVPTHVRRSRTRPAAASGSFPRA
jgi:hypothetical protein